MRSLAEIVVIIVGFRNADDVLGCLAALARLEARPAFEVVVAENGGATAAGVLAEEARRSEFLRCVQTGMDVADFACATTTFEMQRPDAGACFVHIAEMSENLGYAGAINVCLGAIGARPGWRAVWVLNPDTQPRPSALSALASHAEARGHGMVGSRMCDAGMQDGSRSCGLRWSRLHGAARSVPWPRRLPAGGTDAATAWVEDRIDSPSGASVFVTRALLGRIGPMEERYFLYFEDVDWGMRAKVAGSVGYAHHSVVQHRGGSTIGSARSRGDASYLSTYLEFRNRIRFVRKFHPGWLGWTVAMQAAHAAAFLVLGAFGNTGALLRGVVDGLRGRSGRPDRLVMRHLAAGVGGAVAVGRQNPKRAASV